MPEAIRIQQDDETMRALAELTKDGTSVSDAVRTSIIEAATRHATRRLRAEVAAVAADPKDRHDAIQVLRDMELLREGCR
jgi:hypothetical protein